jgi:hypothetical protein
MNGGVLRLRTQLVDCTMERTVGGPHLLDEDVFVGVQVEILDVRCFSFCLIELRR